MNKHRKTPEAIFHNPVNGNIEWSRIEALLVALGCVAIEGAGSSVTFGKDGMRAYFHRPHPQKEALRYRLGQSPNAPASGKVFLRVPPDVHSAAIMAAESKGKSLNQWAAEVLAEAARG